MFKVYDEVESLSGIAKLGGECEIYDEPESSNEGGVRLSFFPRILAFLLVCFFVPFAAFASPAFLRPAPTSPPSMFLVLAAAAPSVYCSFARAFFLLFLIFSSRSCVLACLLACLLVFFPFSLSLFRSPPSLSPSPPLSSESQEKVSKKKQRTSRPQIDSIDFSVRCF